MPQPMVIIGASGHGREALDVVEAINEVTDTFEFIGFLDDADGPFEAAERRNAKIIGPVSDLAVTDASYLIGIANPQIRRRIDEMAMSWGRSAATAIHPAATIGSDVEIGPGAIVSAGVRITTNVRVGRHVHVNLNATISHDTRIGDYVTITPGVAVSGSVSVGDLVYLGAGSSTIHGISIGQGTTVGAGAVVIGDLPDGVVAVGVPARPLRR